jgi:hypothetical protein
MAGVERSEPTAKSYLVLAHWGLAYGSTSATQRHQLDGPDCSSCCRAIAHLLLRAVRTSTIKPAAPGAHIAYIALRATSRETEPPRAPSNSVAFFTLLAALGVLGGRIHSTLSIVGGKSCTIRQSG